MNVLVDTVSNSGILGIVEIFVNTIKALFAGIGSTIVDFFEDVVLTEGGALTTFAQWTIVFMAMSFVLTIVWAILRKVG